MNKLWQSRSFRMLVLYALAAPLVWEVASRSFASYVADIAPQTTLWLHPRQPAALLELADRMLNDTSAPEGAVEEDLVSAGRSDSTLGNSATSAKNSKDLNSAFFAFESVGKNESINRPILPSNASVIRALAAAVLLGDPLNPAALQVLGQLAEASGDDVEAGNFMSAAARLSLHDEVVNYWLMRRSMQKGDYRSAVYYADILLRTTPELGQIVVPVLARAAEDRDAVGFVRTALAENPPWRASFFQMLPNSITDARTPLDLLLALRGTPNPPKVADISGYINFLTGRRLYGLAYYTWLQFLPVDELHHAGFLFNGDFALPPSGLPFDWVISQGSGVTIDIVQNPDDKDRRALLVDFQFGRVEYQSVTQLIMLGPGTYAFTAEYKGQLVGPRGLKWRIVCADRPAAPIGESSMMIGIVPKWKNVEFSFTVPTTDCRAQYVRLDLDARMASEQLISGSVLFSQLHISRAANPS